MGTKEETAQLHRAAGTYGKQSGPVLDPSGPSSGSNILPSRVRARVCMCLLPSLFPNAARCIPQTASHSAAGEEEERYIIHPQTY